MKQGLVLAVLHAQRQGTPIAIRIGVDQFHQLVHECHVLELISSNPWRFMGLPVEIERGRDAYEIELAKRTPAPR